MIQQNINLNTTSSGDAVRYFLVQHVPDVFRRETVNVGVIVDRDGELAARFFGERGDGQLDGRALRTFEYPSVYEQWVRYWRRVLVRRRDSLAHALTKSNGGHFNVFEAGNVTGSLGDDLHDVCSYVYSMLVSDGGLTEALGRSKDDEAGQENLRFEVSSAFRDLSILAPEPSLLVPHPVQPNMPVAGIRNGSHTFSFMQRNAGNMFLIEPVNFATRQQMGARNHAGWAAMAFEDILAAHPATARPISLIRSSRTIANEDLLRYSLSLLEKVSTVIDWSSADRRRKFLEERREIALAA